MKRTYYILFMGLAFVGMTFFSSCLKNNKYYVDFSKVKPSIELPLAAENKNGPASVALDVTGEPVEWRVVVNVASPETLGKEVTAEIAIDQDAMDEYNEEQEAAVEDEQQAYLDADTSHHVSDADYPADYEPYELLPDSLYSIDKTNLTVASGEREAYATLSIKTWKMDFTKKYMLPYTITNSNIAISNWNHLLMHVQAKNIYDGDYKNSYNGDIVGVGENTQTLVTLDANTCSTPLNGVYTGNMMTIYVDPNTNKVTVGGAGIAPSVTDPSSHYDPATKTFYLKYEFLGGYQMTQTLVKK